jgi:hypothetical protein
MKKHLITQAIVITCISLFTVGCVSPRPTATAGASLGRLIALPLGFTASALDEVLKQTGDIAAANPRYDTDQTGDIAAPNPKYDTDHNPVSIMLILTIISML